MTTSFEIIWPEHRWVSGDKIAVWFSDAVANGDISDEYASDPLFADRVEGLELMAMELHNLGHITLGRGRGVIQ